MMYRKYSLLIVVGAMMCALPLIAQTSNTVGQADAKLQTTIEGFAKLHAAITPAKSTSLPALPAGPSGTLTKPDACGKTFTPAEMLTTGANIGVSAGGVVTAPAEPGNYTFYLYLKVEDDAGNIIREASSAAKASIGAAADFGYIESIKKCYCDAKKLTVTTVLASISPSGKFVLHQNITCTFEVK